MKKLNLFFIVTLLSTIFSCSDYEEPLIKTPDINFNENVKLDNGVLTISSIAYLNSVVENYKNDVEGQNQFINQIKSLQNRGFKPLTPVFEGLTAKQIEELAIRKKERIDQRNADFGMYAKNSQDLELDLDEDGIIKDPVLAALVNEDRKIIVGNLVYKYTELGLLYVDKNNEVVIQNYLDSKTPQQKMQMLIDNKNEHSTTGKPEEKIIDLGNGLSNFRMTMPPIEDELGGSGGGGSSNSGQNYGDGTFNPANFGSCTIESQGFWEGIFGTSEACLDYYPDNRRIKVTFWNENYLVFSSIGSSARFQKRVTLDLWLFSISWWEKSYADQIRLGINNVTFKYDFNVPAYNVAQYNYSTTFFEYNGTKYNVNGQVIPTVPTSAGSFQFPVNNQNNVIDITIAGANVQINNGQVNQAIDALLNQAISVIQNYDVRQELAAKKAAGTLEVRAVYAVPFTNNVKFIMANQNWASNNENAIVKYFDFNFLITYNSNYSTASDYLNGLQGATSYSEDKVDLFGAALHHNFWKGRRLIKE